MSASADRAGRPPGANGDAGGRDAGGAPVPPTWSLATIEEIPDDHPPGWWDHEAATEGFGGRWHPIRRHFGIQGFGIAASGADAGAEVVVPHDETGPANPASTYVGGQEEVYVVLRGAAVFTLDGRDQHVEAGEVLYVPPAVHRSAVAAVDDTLVLGVGGTPGVPYSGIDPAVEITPPLPGSVAARRAAAAKDARRAR